MTDIAILLQFSLEIIPFKLAVNIFSVLLLSFKKFLETDAHIGEHRRDSQDSTLMIS